jgi:hypothetical protein
MVMSMQDERSGMFNYSIFSRRTGEWLGAVNGADSADDATRQWLDCWGSETGYTARMLKLERSGVNTPPLKLTHTASAVDES